MAPSLPPQPFGSTPPPDGREPDKTVWHPATEVTLDPGQTRGETMRDTIGWLIEQACRFADARVCAIANLTDDEAEPTVLPVR
jgi:hypothetical protein